MPTTGQQCHICGNAIENAAVGRCLFCGTDTLNTDSEKVILREACDFCKDGALATVWTGQAVLTNTRFLAGKSRDNKMALIITCIIAAFLGIFCGLKLRIGAVKGAALGAAVGIVVTTITKMFQKSSGGMNALTSLEFNIPRQEISAVEYGNRGIRKMLVIKAQNGDLCKISVTDKENWKAVLEGRQ